jgi:prepilin-type N-terminal cleavage/methylation domain-containing protein
LNPAELRKYFPGDMWVGDGKKGESHPGEVKMIKKNKERVGRLYECCGFTLIELLVVITVIVNLFAIAIPTYLGYKCKAHDLSALANAQSLLKPAIQILLDGIEINYIHDPGDGNVIGDENDDLGHYIPEFFTLSPLVSAKVEIFNYFAAGSKISSVGLWVYSEKGTNDPSGLNGKKTFHVYMDGLTGSSLNNF